MDALKLKAISVVFAVTLTLYPMCNIIVASAQTATAGQAECVMEQESRRILYASNSDKALPMASTTKIVTALTVLESQTPLNQIIKIPSQAVGIEGSSVYLQEGAEYSIEDLLYGLMLRSGNDCATALALCVGGAIDNFSVMMNSVAQKTGALNSNFKNPHGLPCPGHYTTACDLCVITCYALQNQQFQTIASCKYYDKYKWKNKNKLLYLYPGAIGVKTGYTKEAGRCLVSAATKDDMTLVATLLNCPTTYERTAELFNDAFKAYKKVRLISPKDIFSIKKDGTEMTCASAVNFDYPLLEEERELVKITVKASDTPRNISVDKEIVGEFTIYLAKQLLFSGNLYKL